MIERADCTLKQYIDWLKQWSEEISDEQIEANVYFHKTLVPPEIDTDELKLYPGFEDRQPVYALWLTVQGKSVNYNDPDGKSTPFREVYDKIFEYMDSAQLKLREKSLHLQVAVLSRYIEDEGIPVSNLPEFSGLYEDVISDDLYKYELNPEEDDILEIFSEIAERERFKRLNGF